MQKKPLAIVGIGCRFPSATNKQDFWNLIRDGIDAISEVPSSRWNVDDYYDSDRSKLDKTNTRWGGFLDNIDYFDPQFFSISPREAMTMDPQQRLLLEVAYETLEDAGKIPELLRGSKTGVFIGIGTHDYSIMLWQKPVNEPFATMGTGNCIAANRISYVFDLKGPSIAIDTACSSSLVALHLACQSIWNGESEMALAGGVNVLLLPTIMVGFSKGGFMSSDGRCKSFSAEADGYVRGEGAGLILLKPLYQAEEDGDFIYGVIRNSATNQDGYSNGLPSPNPIAQEALIRQVYSEVGINPAEVKYIEAHGTGTAIGDPIEMKALGAVLAENRDDNNYCFVGSVKTNIGHTETAAGIAGVIKLALMLQHRQIPPNLHFNQPNPQINFQQWKLRVPNKLQSFEEETKIIAGVNSFGFGGTNAHVIIEEYYQNKSNLPINQPDLINNFSQPYLFTLSAKNESGLLELAQRYQSFLTNNQSLELADICYTNNTKRTHYNHRLSFIINSQLELEQKLTAFIEQKDNKQCQHSVINSQQSNQVAFLFTGQGSQYLEMGYQLYQSDPFFLELLNECNEILQQIQINYNLARWNLFDILYPQNDQQLFSEDEVNNNHNIDNQLRLNQTLYTQSALFSLEYSLAKLWMSWGIKPDVLIGHSIGEYVAACIAEVFSLEDALKLLIFRGKLMQESGIEGGMLSIFAKEKTVNQIIASYPDVNISAINNLENIVISGKINTLNKIQKELQALKINYKFLEVSCPFHSLLLEPILTQFKTIAEQVNYFPAQIPIISNVTGKLATSEISTPNYWLEHIIKPVQFYHSFQELLSKKEANIFIEIGSQPTLLSLAKSITNSINNFLFLPSIRQRQNDLQVILNSLAKLYHQGLTIQWENVQPQNKTYAYQLPTYPFQRQRFWWEGATLNQLSSANINYQQKNVHHLLGDRLFLANSSEIYYQNFIINSNLKYLKDHRLKEQIVLPATAYIEMGLAVAKNYYQTDNLTIENLTIENPLLLSEIEASTIIQTTLTPLDNQKYQVRIFSQKIDDSQTNNTNFILNAVMLVNQQESSDINYVDLENLQTQFNQQIIDCKDYYQQLKTQGLNYGNNFQAIKTLYGSEFEALAEIKIPVNQVTKIDENQSYLLHPILLDACFQVIGATSSTMAENGVYLPVGLESLYLQENVIDSCWVWIKIEPNIEQKTIKANLFLLADSGKILAQIKGLSLRYINHQYLTNLISQSQTEVEVNQESLDLNKLNNQNNWLYEIAWQTQPLIKENQLETNSRSKWLIFADKQGIGAKLTDELSINDDETVLIFIGENFEQINESNYQINPQQPQHFKQLIDELYLRQPENKSNWNIIYLWSLDFTDKDTFNTENINNFYHFVCDSILYLIQSLNTHHLDNLKMWLVTYKSQAIIEAPQTLHNGIWGLGKVINLEYPNWQCFCLDLDSLSLDSAVKIIHDESLHSTPEKQIAYHNHQRYVARLVAKTESSFNNNQNDTKPIRLQISKYGVLDNLHLAPLQRISPQAGEVEIQVYASGVNFRDVLNALGMLQEYLEVMGFTDASQVPFGGECAGIISAVGEGVSQFQVGDEVIAAQAVGSLRSFVTVKADFVVLKPKNLSFTQAATIPTTFLTAYYGLHYLAKITQNDRILIHSGAGGVGQAAIQLAKQANAEILTTASEGKWNFLHSQGIEKVMNSRNLDFAEEIMKFTEGKGVNLILNSFNGDFIPASLKTMAVGGRFVEIGKIGIWNERQVKEMREDVSYFPFDLLDVSTLNPQLISRLLTELITEFEKGNLQPLPHQVFSVDKSADAFRYLAQAKQIGKVVISFPINANNSATPSHDNHEGKEIESKIVTPEGSYLITGAYGALGLHITQWLVNQGAKHLILIGRNQPSEVARKTIEDLTASGVLIETKLADITDEKAINEIIDQIKDSLKGVIHTAGIIEDSLLENLSSQQFQSVLAPKVKGSWLLHQATLQIPLDWFVCFSSVVSVFGSTAQANYTVANAFMDNLMQYRRGLGLSGISINWSVWGGGGMASQLASPLQQRLQQQGLEEIPPSAGLEILQRLLTEKSTQVIVFPVKWSIFQNNSPYRFNNTFFEAFFTQDNPSASVNTNTKSNPWLEKLAQATSEIRYEMLCEKICQQLAKALGFNDIQDIDIHENFSNLGMDSLMAVEFKNSLEATFNNVISLTLISDYPSVDLLAEYINQELLTTDFLNQIASKIEQKTENKASLNKENSEESTMSQITSNKSQITEVESANNQQNLTHKIEVTKNQSNEINFNIDDKQIKKENITIKPEFYNFALMPEYLALKNDLERVEKLGNPFFTLHQGIAEDTTIINNQKLINYSSYNYLGMSGDPFVIKQTQDAIAMYGTSVSASRLLSGERPLHQELEQEIANFLGTEASIVYVGGHATNVSTIGHLFGKKDLIICDALAHNSIQQGCQLSGATIISFAHNDVLSLEQILAQQREQYEKVLIAVEGVYSTDGDIAPLPAIVKLKQQYQTFLMVDEAHSIGVLGLSGRGIKEHFNLQADDVDLWMGTLSKSFASCGGYIAGCRELIEYLKYTASGFVFSVGMSPANTASALASLKLLQQEPERVIRLQSRAKFFLDLAKNKGLNTGLSQESPIIPVIVGEPHKAVTICKLMAEKGINVNPMVYPSVPYNSSRLRFFITSLHTESQIQFTLDTLANIIVNEE